MLSVPSVVNSEMPDLFDDPGAEQRALAEALELFDSSREGAVLADDAAWPVRFVCCGTSGKLILSCPEEVLDLHEHILFIPEEKEDALQLLITPQRCDDCSTTDHYLAYNGKPEGVNAPAWAECWVDAARHGPWVFDGEPFMAPNPLAPIEPALCKQLNADRAALARVCRRFAGLDIPQPTCVGVIPSGLHIRARFGVVRVPFPRRMPAPDDARRAVEAMLREVPG